MLNLLKNPITRWLGFTILAAHQEWKFRKFKVSIGYMSMVKNSDLGLRVTLHSRVILSNCLVGKFTYFADGTSAVDASFGSFCSIGPECRIGLGKHPATKFVSTHPVFFSTGCQAQISFADRPYFEEHQSITIGSDVWLGARVMIVDGVKIGDGAVVAAGAVVTKDVPAFAIVAGVPAKIIRYRFEQHEIDRISRDKWWNMPVEVLQDEFRKFHDVKDYVNSRLGSVN